MSVLNHAGRHRRTSSRAGLNTLAGFVLGFLFALPATAFFAMVAVPALVPLDNLVVPRETSASMALGLALVAGLGTAVCVAARSSRR